MATVLDVFLSSTAQDLAAYRNAVYEQLRGIEFFRCVRQEDFGARDAEALAFCREKAKASDLFVGLIGMRRGWEPDGDNLKRSITEIEHDVAKEEGRRRFLWITPDHFPVPGNLHETAALHKWQLTFRKRIMAGGERIVSQKGFESPDRLAFEIVKQLLACVATSELITMLRPELARRQNGSSAEDQAPAITAAVEKLADDEDVDLFALAKNPKNIDLVDLEAKLTARAEAHEAAGQSKITEGKGELKTSAEYWRHIGALAFLHNTQKALTAYTRATALDPDEPDGWRHLGELQYRLGDMAAAERAFETVRTLGIRIGSKQAESMGYLRLGWIHLSHGNLAKAEEMQLKALKLNEELGSREGMARAYGNLGNIYQTRDELPKAEEMHLKALKLEEEVGGKEGMAVAYGNLGIIYQARNELPKAEEMQLKALKLNDELGSKEGIAAAYGNLGGIYQTRGELLKAEETLLKALKLNEELGRKVGMGIAYGNLGIIYQTRGELPKAEEIHLKALKLEEELGHKKGMAITYGSLGSIYAARKNKSRMCECWRKERDLWREMGLTDKAAEAERRLKLHGCKKI